MGRKNLFYPLGIIIVHVKQVEPIEEVLLVVKILSLGFG